MSLSPQFHYLKNFINVASLRYPLLFTGIAATPQRRAGGGYGFGWGGGGGGGGTGKAGDAGFIHKPVLNLDTVNNIDKVICKEFLSFLSDMGCFGIWMNVNIWFLTVPTTVIYNLVKITY